jgi:hypothetical protein
VITIWLCFGRESGSVDVDQVVRAGLLDILGGVGGVELIRSFSTVFEENINDFGKSPVCLI